MSLAEEFKPTVNVNQPTGEVQEETETEAEAVLKFGLGNLLDTIFQSLARLKDPELVEKIAFTEYEIEAVNEATMPLLMRVAEMLHMKLEELYALLTLTVIIVPRVQLLASWKKKESEKKEEVKQNGGQGQTA